MKGILLILYLGFGSLNSPIVELNEASTITSLDSFNGKSIQKNQVLLEWTISDHEDIVGFELLHASKGKPWEGIAFIECDHSQMKRAYHYVHNGAVIGTNNYRLKPLLASGRKAGVKKCKVKLSSKTQKAKATITRLP